MMNSRVAAAAGGSAVAAARPRCAAAQRQMRLAVSAVARRSVKASSAAHKEALRPSQNGDGKFLAGTVAVHGGEREGRPRISDSLTTPIVQTSTYSFRNTQELIDYQEGNYGSYEYGR